MGRVREMLDTHPRAANVDPAILAEAIEALVECANACVQCADACLSEEDVATMAKCIRLNLDCADMCTTASRVLSRQTGHEAGVASAVLESCIAACKSCGDECAGHAEHMAHCRVCAQSCLRCENACRALQAAIGG